jgi:hypothetical protein
MVYILHFIQLRKLVQEYLQGSGMGIGQDGQVLVSSYTIPGQQVCEIPGDIRATMHYP